MSQKRQNIPNPLPAAVLAELSGVSCRRLRQMAEAGILQRDKDGRFPAWATLAAMLTYYRTHAGDLKTKVLVEKARLAAADADLKEMRAKEKEGDLVPMARVAALVADCFLPLREALLEAPAEMAPRCNPVDPLLARVALERWRDDTLARARAAVEQLKKP